MDEEVIEAKLIHVIFHNENNFYSVLKLHSYGDDEDDIIATGYFREIGNDFIYKLHGKFIDHPKYGVQFQVSFYDKLIERNRNSLIRYLSGREFSGIGKKSAEMIVDHFGENFIEKLKDNPEIINELSFLNDKKKQTIKEVILNSDEDDLSIFFARYGIHARYMKKIDMKYGSDAIEKIKSNPYCLIEDNIGIGFNNVDKIAASFEFDINHPSRIRGLMISKVLDYCFRHGDCYIEYDILKNEMFKEDSNIDFDQILYDLCNDKLLFQEENRIYHFTQYESECLICRYLKGFPYLESDEVDLTQVENDLAELEANNHIQYETFQKEAIMAFFKQPLLIITGGPGSGKTTIVSAMIDLYTKYFPYHNVALCAPTGRASKRLAECTHHDSSTIHSLLHYDLDQNEFGKNSKEPLNVDLLVIDEFSMVDEWLFAHLLDACQCVKKIIVIGDANQLPSVGCGNVLKDLMESELFPIIELKKIFRQHEGSDVIDLAHHITMNDLEQVGKKNDVLFLETNEEMIRTRINQFVEAALEKGYENKDIQILAPMYQGLNGIHSLNSALQQIMNPSSPTKKEIKSGFRIFREGDKVLQLKNQSEYDVYNGDIGEIVAVDEVEGIIEVEYSETSFVYQKDSLSQLTHAFAISIHKSQGSEYPIVIIPIVKAHQYMLTKRLLYTAVTRAKKALVLVGSEELFIKGVKSKDRSIRKTTLKNRLKKYVSISLFASN